MKVAGFNRKRMLGQGRPNPYLKSWDCACHDTDPNIVLRLAAHRNFLDEGPGAGPMQPFGGPKPDACLVGNY